MRARRILRLWAVIVGIGLLTACAGGSTGGDVVTITTIEKEGRIKGLRDETLSQLEEIKQSRIAENENPGIRSIIRQTPSFTVEEYLKQSPAAASQKARNYTIGGYDVLDIVVYEEADLSRENVQVSAEGAITFPLIGKVEADGLTTSELERRIADKLAEQQYLLDAHVSVTVKDYRSKQYIVLGSVKAPGTFPLSARERVLDAISKAGGIDFERGGKTGMLIRTENPETAKEGKLVVRIDLSELLKSGDQMSNLPLEDKDLLYIPKAENFFIIGQVKTPGSYPYLEKEITLVEAISKAGGFTEIAARNKTRIIRVENGVEKIIHVQVDAITDAGKRAQDVVVLPGDVIVVPESFF